MQHLDDQLCGLCVPGIFEPQLTWPVSLCIISIWLTWGIFKFHLQLSYLKDTMKILRVHCVHFIFMLFYPITFTDDPYPWCIVRWAECAWTTWSDLYWAKNRSKLFWVQSQLIVLFIQPSSIQSGTSAFLRVVHKLCGAVEGRLSHILPHWLKTGWQSVISQGNTLWNTPPWLGIEPGPQGGQ